MASSGNPAAAAKATPQRAMPPSTKLKGVSSSAQRVSNHTPPLVQMLALLPPRALQAITVAVAAGGSVHAMFHGDGVNTVPNTLVSLSRGTLSHCLLCVSVQKRCLS